LQLTAASQCGFRIPKTLITQNPSDVKAFYDELGGKIIVKPVVGTAGPLLFTQFVSEMHLSSSDSIRACPAIYQEYIPGTRHIRLNCFGSRSFASSIETSDLDWRPNLTVPLAKWEVPIELHKRVRQVLDSLELEMGVLDLKETPSGEMVWFEVNPQGQFLFLEGLTGEPLTEYFADYLQDELRKVDEESWVECLH
jgi:glutathione synthase/RimK-type ligase-like ATP-grasp enzyme